MLTTIVNIANSSEADEGVSKLFGYMEHKKFLIIRTDDHKLCYVSYKSTKNGMPSVKVKLLFAKVLDKVNEKCLSGNTMFNINLGNYTMEKILAMNMPFVYVNFLRCFYSYHGSGCMFIYTTDSVDEALDIYSRRSLEDENGIQYIPKIDIVKKEQAIVNLIQIESDGYTFEQFEEFCKVVKLENDPEEFQGCKSGKKGVMIPNTINQVSYYQLCLFLDEDEEDIGYNPIMKYGKDFKYFETPDYKFVLNEFVPKKYPPKKGSHLKLIKK